MDEQDENRDAGWTDDWTDDDVRELLATAHHAEPDAERMPDDVAARLDDVLAGLVAEREGSAADEGGTAHVHSLAEARTEPSGHGRRHTRRRWVVASGVAAALVVGGVVLGSVGLGMNRAGVMSQGNDSADTASSAEESAPTAAQDGAGEGPAAVAGDLPSRPPLGGSVSISSDDPEAGALGLVLKVLAAPSDAAGYAADTDERSTFRGSATPSSPTATSPTPVSLTPARARRLLGCAVDGGTSYAVSYDGRAAQATVEPAGGGTRLVRVLVCNGAGEPVEVERVTLDPTP